MPIRDEILALPPVARRRRKAHRLAENAASRLPITWQMGQGQNRTAITVTAANFDGEALILWVTASRGDWSKIDDVRIVNPPIMVPTGRKIPNPNPDPDSAAMINEYEENPVAAIRAIIEDAVRLWQGRGE